MRRAAWTSAFLPVAAILLPAAQAWSAVIYVRASATGAGNGANWNDAYRYLSQALSVAVSGDEVWVAAATYRPDESPTHPTGNGDRALSFVLPSGVAIYGGFSGNETLLDQRDPIANITILSGDLDGDDQFYDPYAGTPLVGYGENSWHVVSTAPDGSGGRVLDGLTIRGGHADSGSPVGSGAGIYAPNGALTVRNCMLREHRSVQPGGAIYHAPATAATLWVENCVIERSVCAVGGGGAIFSGSGSALDLRSSIIRRNGGSTAAVSASGASNARIADCRFEQNATTALSLWRRPRVVLRCDFMQNRSDGTGAVLLVHTPGPTADFVSCRFLGNVSTAPVGDPESGGGAIRSKSTGSSTGPVLRATNCVFVGNTAVRGGAVMLINHDLSGGSASFLHCTFSENVATTDGGAIWAGNSDGVSTSSVTIRNSILWNNRDSSGIGPSAQVFVGAGTPTVSYSLIAGGWSGGTGIVVGDPRFLRAPSAGVDGLWDGMNDDYGDLRLAYGSPAIDAGDSGAVPTDAADLDGDGNVAEPLPLDAAGQPRRLDDPCAANVGVGAPPVDMGAHERRVATPNQSVIFVDADASGAGDGTSWADALPDLQSALCLARTTGAGVITQVWVAEGTYTPGVYGDAQSSTFDLVSGVAIYGGFAGNETALADRRPAERLTILSGDLGRLSGNATLVDDYAAFPGGGTFADNAQHVVTATNVSEAVLDGFTIRGGRATALDASGYGGGVRIAQGDGPKIANCTLEYNSAFRGAAVSMISGTSAMIRACTLRRNHATDDGGAVFVSSLGSPRILDCLFQENDAVDSGGAISVNGGNALVVGSRLLRNQADRGGGLLADAGATLHVFNTAVLGNVVTQLGGGAALIAVNGGSVVANCTFVGNTTRDNGDPAGEAGAAMYVNGSAGLRIGSCTIAGNIAGGTSPSGGAIQFVSAGPQIRNCILWGNTLGSGAPSQIAGLTPGTGVQFCNVEGGWSGAGNIAADPMFLRAPSPGSGGWDGVLDDYGNLQLASGSPCVDVGSNVELPPDFADLDCDENTLEPTPRDFAGAPRALGAPPVVDIGAYELGGVVSTRIYVDAASTVANPGGTSWADALPDLQVALLSAVGTHCDRVEIWVARGTYHPSAVGDRDASFALRDNVVLYGGFAGTEESLSDRTLATIAANPSILSGDLENDDPSTADNSYSVVTAAGASESAVLDGFVIRGGAATSAPGPNGVPRSGGGLKVVSGAPTIRNCTIAENSGACAADLSLNGATLGVSRVMLGGSSASAISQSLIDVQGLLTVGGELATFGATFTGLGSIELAPSSTLAVLAMPPCAADVATQSVGVLGATGVGLFVPSGVGVPAEWRMENAGLHDAVVSGSQGGWVIAPAALSQPASLTWTGNLLRDDLSAGGVAEGRFHDGGVLTITGRLYDGSEPGAALLHDGVLLVAQVGAFRVRETAANTLTFTEPPVIRPSGGYLVSNDRGFILGGTQRITMSMPAAAALVNFSGAIALNSAVQLVLTPTAPPQTETILRSSVTGTGDVRIDPGAQLVLEGNASLNLSGLPDDVCAATETPGAPPGGVVSIAGSFVVRDNARVYNTRVDVHAASLQGANQIVHNDIRLIERAGLGGQFFADGGVTIACNTITAEGDRYLDLDPDPDDGVSPALFNNRIRVIIQGGVRGERGELLELRTPDYNHALNGGASGAYPLSAAAGAQGYADPWALDRLEVLPGAKVNLTNRQGFEFQPSSFADPEALYVRQLILHDGATLNTGLQRVYYQSISMGAGARMVDIPVLGFSLKVIGFDDDTPPPNNEFDVRVKSRLEDPADAQPTNPAAPRLRGSIERITADPEGQTPIPAGHAGVMDMRTKAPGGASARSVAAHGAFARAGEESVFVAFEYLWLRGSSNPQVPAELVVYLSDSPEPRSAANAARFVVAGRVRPPAGGAFGAIGSGRFATFEATIPRGALNFRRGTYVELELRGVDARLWIDEWDPFVRCTGECANVNGDPVVDARDLLTVVAAYGQGYDPTDFSRSCLDLPLNGDQYLDAADLIAWDSILFDPSRLNLCFGDGSPRGVDEREPASPVVVPSDSLIVAGKQRLPAGQSYSDKLYFADAAGACTQPPTFPPAAAGPYGHRANGRLSKAPGGDIHQLHGASGLIRLRDARNRVPIGSASFSGKTVYVGMSTQNAGFGSEPLGVPLLDAAFDPVNPNIVYVAPVIVGVAQQCDPADPPTHAYRAAAKLQLNDTGPAYSVLALYGTDPYCDPQRNATPPDASVVETSRIKEIEVDAFGNVFTLATKAAHENEWLLAYRPDGTPIAPIRLVELFPGAAGAPRLLGGGSLFVSRAPAGAPTAGRLYLTSTRNDPGATRTYLYRCVVQRDGGGGVTGLTADGVIAMDDMTQITAITERIDPAPAQSRLFVVGAMIPYTGDEYFFNDGDPMPAQAALAIVAAPPGGSIVAATPWTCHDLALPISAVISDRLAPCIGDLDGNRVINLTDLATLLSNYGRPSGATLAHGDIDGDGDVDLTDLATLLARFGTSC